MAQLLGIELQGPPEDAGGRRGFGGGHQSLAAAQIPLPANATGERAIRRTVNGLIKRFLKATGKGKEPSLIPALSIRRRA